MNKRKYSQRLCYFFLTAAFLVIIVAFCRTEAQVSFSDTSSASDSILVQLKPVLGMEPQKKSPTGAMIRSVLIPGWGQLYTKHYVKGGLIFCLESGLVLSAIIEDKKARDVYQRNYKEYLDRIDRRNGYIWWTVGLIAFSMIDAYVDAHLFNFDEEEITLSIEQSPYPSEVQLVIRIHIPELR